MVEFATNRRRPHPVREETIQRQDADGWVRCGGLLRAGPAVLARALILTVAAALAIAGCSNRQAYHSLQEMEQSRCTDWPAHLYRECLEASDATYREYEAAREQAREASG